jgi:folate-binding protein YgfZ
MSDATTDTTHQTDGGAIDETGVDQALTAIPLPDRAVFRLSGAETPAFLQGLVTVDVETLDIGQAAHGALLTPQGKLQFDFVVLRASQDTYLMDVPRTTMAAFAKRLMFYRLRAKIEIAPEPGLAVASLPHGTGSTLPDGSHVFTDPRNTKLGARAFVAATDAAVFLTALGYDIRPAGDYHALRIAAGIPEAPFDFEYGSMFPHDIALDQTGGVDFRKGCFVGQEVVSRMEHRGTARRRIVQVAIDGEAPERGVALSLDGKSVGEMGSNQAGKGLAIIRLDRAADALTGKALEAGDARLTVALPAWSSYALPGAAGKDESAA